MLTEKRKKKKKREREIRSYPDVAITNPMMPSLPAMVLYVTILWCKIANTPYPRKMQISKVRNENEAGGANLLNLAVFSTAFRY